MTQSSYEYYTERAELARQAAQCQRRAYIEAQTAGLVTRAAYHYKLAGAYESEARRMLRRTRRSLSRPASGALRVA